MEQKNSEPDYGDPFRDIPDRFDATSAAEGRAELQREDDLRIRMLALDSAARIGQGTLSKSPFTPDQSAVDVLAIAGKFDHYLRTGELTGPTD